MDNLREAGETAKPSGVTVMVEFMRGSTFIGTLGLFVALMFLFIRVLPMISIFEMRQILPEAKVEEAE